MTIRDNQQEMIDLLTTLTTLLGDQQQANAMLLDASCSCEGGCSSGSVGYDQWGQPITPSRISIYDPDPEDAEDWGVGDPEVDPPDESADWTTWDTKYCRRANWYVEQLYQDWESWFLIIGSGLSIVGLVNEGKVMGGIAARTAASAQAGSKGAVALVKAGKAAKFVSSVTIGILVTLIGLALSWTADIILDQMRACRTRLVCALWCGRTDGAYAIKRLWDAAVDDAYDDGVIAFTVIPLLKHLGSQNAFDGLLAGGAGWADVDESSDYSIVSCSACDCYDCPPVAPYSGTAIPVYGTYCGGTSPYYFVIWDAREGYNNQLDRMYREGQSKPDEGCLVTYKCVNKPKQIRITNTYGQTPVQILFYFFDPVEQKHSAGDWIPSNGTWVDLPQNGLEVQVRWRGWPDHCTNYPFDWEVRDK